MTSTLHPRDQVMRILAAIIPTMVVAISITMQPGFVQGMVDFMGIDEVQAGYIASAEVMGLMAGTVIFAFIAHLFNWRPVFAGSLGLVIAANILTLLLGNAQTLLFLRLIAGFGAGLVTAIGFAALANTTRPGRNYGWLVACVIGFSAVGFAFLPNIFELGGYNALILIYSMIVGLCVAVALLLHSDHDADHTDVAHSDGGSLLSIPGLLSLAAVLLFFIGYAAAWTYMTLIGRDAGLADDDINFVLSATQFAGVAGALSMAFLTERLRHKWLAFIVFGSGIASIVCLGFSPSLSVFFALNAVFQFCWNGGQPLLLAIIASRQSSGQLLRFAIPLQFIGMGVAPSIAAYLLDASGGYGLVITVAALLAAASLVTILPFIFLFKNKNRAGSENEMSTQKTILMIGTADTKSDEMQYLAERIRSLGVNPVIMDVGVLQGASFPVEYTNEDVANFAGTTIQGVIDSGDENSAMTLMANGATALATKLHAEGKIDGMIALGGSMGTDLALDVAGALPIGVPKFVVSTIAFSPTIAPNRLSPDIMMILWAGGLYGLNAACKAVLSQAAGAVAGAARAVEKPMNDKPVIGMSSLGGSCLPYMKTLSPALEARGYEVAVFHATGMGGMAIERLAEQKYFAAVLDLAMSELTNAAHGGILTAGPDRLTAAGKNGIPQIVAPGASDMYDIATWQPIPEHLKERGYHAHNRLIASVGTTPEERVQTAELICERLAGSSGPTAFVLPRQGIHNWDVEGGDLHDPEAMAVYADAFKRLMPSSTEFHDLDVHISDDVFCEVVLSIFDKWVADGVIPPGVKS